MHGVLSLLQNEKMKKEAEKENIEILKRYCENRYTWEDLQSVFSWFGESGSDIVRRITLKGTWTEITDRDYTGYQTSYVEDQILDRIHHRINQLETDKPGTRHKVKKNRNFFFYFSRVSAILFLPLLAISLIYLNNKSKDFIPEADLTYTELHAPPYGRISFYLSDSSRIWLNNGSTLKYPVVFAGRDRKVILEGEAYFDVRKDLYRPFKVEAGDIVIQVLGTRFNISNYTEDEAIVTTLEDGKVRIKFSGQGQNNQVIHELTPSRQSVFMKESRKVQARTVNTLKYTSWKDGTLYLLDDPMSLVKKKLERWYNVDIVIEDPIILEYRYTGRFRQEPVEKVLRMMTIATPIRYTIKKGTKQPDNTYSRDTIIIRKR